MKKLSSGADSTLGEYRKLASLFFGDTSPAVKFIDKKIESSAIGAAEEVVADEGQMVNLLTTLASQKS